MLASLKGLSVAARSPLPACYRLRATSDRTHRRRVERLLADDGASGSLGVSLTRCLHPRRSLTVQVRRLDGRQSCSCRWRRAYAKQECLSSDAKERSQGPLFAFSARFMFVPASCGPAACCDQWSES